MAPRVRGHEPWNLERRFGVPLFHPSSCAEVVERMISKALTVYWSSADTNLVISDGWTAYHNPAFPMRLGLHGPDSFAIGRLHPNVIGLDCSRVANSFNLHGAPSVHISYLYIPQILLDMTQTLTDVPPADVIHRVSLAAPNNRAFQMTPVSDR